MAKTVIKRSNLPMKLPIWDTVVLWLLLDRLRAPGWIWGAAITILVLAWAGCLYEFCTQIEVEVLEKKDK